MIAARPGILLVGDQLNLGGTEGQFAEVACGLDQSHWDVHVTCLRAVGPLRARIEAAGIPVWSCGRGSFKSPRFALAVWQLARYLRTHRIGVLHAFDFYSNILGVLAGRLARVPAVIASQRELGDLRSPLQRRAYRGAMRLADYVLVNTAVVGDALVRDGVVAPARVATIPNGVDTARFSPAAAVRRSRHVTVGALGCLRAEKGFEHLVQAVALVREHDPRVRLAIWGDGPCRDDLARSIAGAGLGEAARLLGPTLQPETALRAMDIFTLTSVSEACSNALLEAMATGVPIVATRVGGNTALVEDEVSGLLVPPGDPSAVAKAIIRLVEDPGFGARLGTAAREVACTRFSRERMLSRIAALYERALAARPTGGA